MDAYLIRLSAIRSLASHGRTSAADLVGSGQPDITVAVLQKIVAGREYAADKSPRPMPASAGLPEGPGRDASLGWLGQFSATATTGKADMVSDGVCSHLFHLLKSRHPGTVVQVGFDVRRQRLPIAASTDKECDRRFVRVRP